MMKFVKCVCRWKRQFFTLNPKTIFNLFQMFPSLTKNILPGDNEWLVLQHRMVKVSERILVRVFELAISVEETIAHQFTPESVEKTEVEKNPEIIWINIS